MSYTPERLVLISHPDSSKTTGEWTQHSYGEDSYPVTNTSYIAPTSATGLYTLFYNSIYAPAGTYSAEHHIIYSNGTWSDGEASYTPHQVTNTDVWVNQTSCADAEYIYIWESSTECRGRFLSPYFSAGVGVGAGTGTLSVVPTQFTQSVPSCVTSVTHPGDLGRQLYYTIAKARSSGTYNIYLDDVFHISVTHTNGTVSSGQVAGEQYAQNYKLYFGQVFVSPSLNTLVTEFTWQPILKKVFCNFW